jgi:hypothetical protein
VGGGSSPDAGGDSSPGARRDRTVALATRSGDSRYVGAWTNSSGTVCRPGRVVGAVSTRAAGEHDAESPAAADERTGAEARTAGRSARRGPMIRAAMLNTLRVAVS